MERIKCRNKWEKKCRYEEQMKEKKRKCGRNVKVIITKRKTHRIKGMTIGQETGKKYMRKNGRRYKQEDDKRG
jgi:hypothetical protein